MRSSAIALFLFTLLCSEAQAQQADSTLRLFAPLMGRTWAGRYADSPEESHIQHVVRWQAMLGGRVVKKVKAVAALDFCQVSFYYWDARDDQVAFVSLTNRGQVAHGSVKSDSGHVVLSGSRATGAPFMLSFRVLADGTLQDRFFNVTDGNLRQGHLIEYMADSSEAVGRALECEVDP
jgi:hypothetical protein